MMNDKKNEENAQMVANMLNIMGFDHSGFCKALCKEHRALQEEFTILCLEWLKTCGSKNYGYDARNKYSHLMGKEFIKFSVFVNT